MFGISGSELTVILIIVLILIGPDHVPHVLKQWIQTARRVKMQWDQAREQGLQELNTKIQGTGLEQSIQELKKFEQ